MTSGGKNRYYSLSELSSWGMVVTLPDQCLTRPCLAESVLVIALGLAVGGVDSLVQVQCIIAFKTQSAELKSSETFVCVLVSSHLRCLIDHVSSSGTTRTNTCILSKMGLLIPPFAILKPKVERF